MAKLKLEVGDLVKETYRGHYSHRRYHGDKNLEANVLGLFSLRTLLKRPRLFWWPRTGEVIEIQGRWWGQDGYDVKIQWKDDGSSEWRLADGKHLRLVKRRKDKS